MSKRKRPVALPPNPSFHPDPAPLYPDIIALGSLGEAVRAAAREQGLDIPARAFRSIGLPFHRQMSPEYGFTVHSRVRDRGSLRVTALFRRRGWWFEGGHADQRLDGSCTELAGLARVVLAWHAGTVLADVRRTAPGIMLNTVDYRYFGVARDSDAPGEPSDVLRTWTDARGTEREETFMVSLTWEPSDQMSPHRRPDGPDPVEIDVATAGRSVYRMTDYVHAKLRRR